MVLAALTPQGYVSWPVNGTTLNPNVGQISGTLWNSDSIFHALRGRGNSPAWQRAASRSIVVREAESLTRVLNRRTAKPGTFANSTPTLWFDERNGRGLADFNIGRNPSVNYIWEVPSLKAEPRALQWVLNGWQWGRGFLRVFFFEALAPNCVAGDQLGMKGDQFFDRPDVLAG